MLVCSICNVVILFSLAISDPTRSSVVIGQRAVQLLGVVVLPEVFD